MPSILASRRLTAWRQEGVERIRSELQSILAPEITVKPPKEGWVEAYTPENKTPLAAYAGGVHMEMVAGARLHLSDAQEFPW
jgi:hypothetical protein